MTLWLTVDNLLSAFFLTHKSMEIEKLIADTINENPIRIEFRHKVINVPRPTLGTLIEVSKYIAELPNFDVKNEMSVVVAQSLAIAKDCGKIPEILAVLMLGRKNLYTEYKLFGKTIWKRDNVKRLAARLQDITAQEYSDILVKIFSEMNCGFFLSIIISLQGINQLKKTTNETTASGQ